LLPVLDAMNTAHPEDRVHQARLDRFNPETCLDPSGHQLLLGRVRRFGRPAGIFSGGRLTLFVRVPSATPPRATCRCYR
jgi:hypothetical protein